MGGFGLWTAQDRTDSNNLRETSAVWLLLRRHFVSQVSQTHGGRLLLHKDNQAVVYVPNAVVSASKPRVAEVRRMQCRIPVLRVAIKAGLHRDGPSSISSRQQE